MSSANQGGFLRVAFETTRRLGVAAVLATRWLEISVAVRLGPAVERVGFTDGCVYSFRAATICTQADSS